MAIALVQQNRRLNVGNDATTLSYSGATTEGNLLVAIVGYAHGAPGDSVDVTAWSSGWTEFVGNNTVTQIDPVFGSMVFAYYKMADGTETGFTVTTATSDFGSAAGYAGPMYIGEFSDVTVGAVWQGLHGPENGAVENSTGHYEHPDHTATAGEIAFYVAYGSPNAPADFTWDTTLPVADGGVALTDSTLRTTSGGTDYSLSVQPVAFATGGAKDGAESIFTYNGFPGVYTDGGWGFHSTVWAMAEATESAAPNAPSYVPRGRKVTVESLPYQVTSEQFLAD